MVVFGEGEGLVKVVEGVRVLAQFGVGEAEEPVSEHAGVGVG